MRYGLIGIQFDNICTDLSKVTDDHLHPSLRNKNVTIHTFSNVQNQRKWISSVINQNSLEQKNEPIWSRNTLSKLVKRLIPKPFLQVFKHAALYAHFQFKYERF